LPGKCILPPQPTFLNRLENSVIERMCNMRDHWCDGHIEKTRTLYTVGPMNTLHRHENIQG